MSKLWPRVSKDFPCKICGKSDWLCRYGDRAQICMRVESAKPAKDGGWYHFYEDKKPEFIPSPRPAPKPLANVESQNQQFQKNCVGDLLNHISIRLGVFSKSLVQVGIGWSPEHKAYTFPMKDGDGSTIGIRLRNDEGKKWAILGSRAGIFIPDCEPQKIAFVCEGPTDTAALLTMGFYAIGKPSCNSGVDQIKACLKRLGIGRAVIISDNDSLKQIGNHEARPGVEGAMRLKKELGLPSVIWIPTGRVKDVREYLNYMGGEAGRAMIENDINQKIWRKG